jgi:hypothetical protein
MVSLSIARIFCSAIQRKHQSIRGDRAWGGSGNTFCMVSSGEDTCLPHGGETNRARHEKTVQPVRKSPAFRAIMRAC